VDNLATYPQKSHLSTEISARPACRLIKHMAQCLHINQRSKQMTYTKEEIAAAINMEANEWAIFFNVLPESDHIEGRKACMRANVAVGYFEPLLPYLPPAV
jgi:hypothetical protein